MSTLNFQQNKHVKELKFDLENWMSKNRCLQGYIVNMFVVLQVSRKTIQVYITEFFGVLYAIKNAILC